MMKPTVGTDYEEAVPTTTAGGRVKSEWQNSKSYKNVLNPKSNKSIFVNMSSKNN